MESLYKSKGNGLIKSIFNPKDIPELEIIELELLAILSDSKGLVRDMCSRLLNAGGKRIRPLMVLYSGMIFSPISKNLIKAALSSELIHMASLVHDDIIDNSPLRRGKPSVNSSWGNHFAVLCGDYLFAKAFGLLSYGRLTRSMDFMVHAIENMCQGEIMQAANRFNTNTDVEMYYNLIGKKTAVFLECCCKSGAAVSGAGKLHIDAVGGYGLHLGYAFQIIDDLLDVCGNEEITGKPKFEDLSQGNITLPIIMLVQSCNCSKVVEEAVNSKFHSKDICIEMSNLLKDAGIIEKCFDIAYGHIEKAKECLEILPQSEYCIRLYNLAEILKARVN